jgi:hypothetical protein
MNPRLAPGGLPIGHVIDSVIGCSNRYPSLWSSSMACAACRPDCMNLARLTYQGQISRLQIGPVECTVMDHSPLPGPGSL